ncbi:MAG TPA: hypothetical protein VM870_09720, partial [Pyrinomonadaceae bacterium]|nr:hypothetical protein [Pyrinomonadaceae bacterium]
GASLFWARLNAEHPQAVNKLRRDERLLSDVLALAAWSPLLGTTLEQNPAYVNWLGRERTFTRVKTQEEFLESLARFALTNTQLDPQTLLARFRRRELLRIYLKDLRDTATIVETTEELSNLADAVLGYALRAADQELNNLYGAPQRLDERGRIGIAEICIIALGKLGSYELNYSSDIDLLFLYSEDGHTSGAGTRGPLTNREYFIKLASAVTRIVGQEGGAYRVDLRLRPHGRDGALASSLEETIRYYRETAHPWELQTLIRARGSAGSATLAARFAAAVRDRVYRRDETVARALAHVRLAKRKIDRHHGPQGRNGYNVKLGSGGIREIEFIAQALQLAYGGHDVWLQAPHTLISLGRLADRRMITESELTNLTAAYFFLRKLEHRLQMEHGLQTHLLPDDAAKRYLIARRMDFAGSIARERFDRVLQTHLGHVRAAFARVFGDGAEEDAAAAKEGADEAPPVRRVVDDSSTATVAEGRGAADEGGALREMSAIYARHLRPPPDDLPMLAGRIRRAARGSLNAPRALNGIERVAFSLAKLNSTFAFDEGKLRSLIRLCGTSETFAEMIANNPALIKALPRRGEEDDEAALDYAAVIRASVERKDNFGAELAALRSVWSKLIVRLAAHDAAGELFLRESNARQSALAVASLDAGYVIARRALARRLRQHDADFREEEIPRL